jgi:hypothetical protein
MNAALGAANKVAKKIDHGVARTTAPAGSRWFPPSEPAKHREACSAHVERTLRIRNISVRPAARVVAGADGSA